MAGKKTKVVWTQESVQGLANILTQHQAPKDGEGPDQATFVKAAISSLKNASGGRFSEKQIIAKSRDIARRAENAGFAIVVPRKSPSTKIVSNWNDVFKAAGMKKARKSSK
jgi:hypothetical protein